MSIIHYYVATIPSMMLCLCPYEILCMEGQLTSLIHFQFFIMILKKINLNMNSVSFVCKQELSFRIF